MNQAIDAPQPSKEQSQAQAILKSIVIPSCPAILMDLRREIDSDGADMQKIGRLVGADVALSVAVLRTVNSPLYGLSRSVDSIGQAVALIGMKQMSALVTSILIRQSLQFKGVNLVRFWDVSTKRSFAMSKLAKGLGSVTADTAQSFGLFCDIGIPLLMQRFPTYGETLKLANDAKEQAFPEVEFDRHGVDHTQIGSMMARAWGLGDTLCGAIRRHHDYAVFYDPDESDVVRRLIAMCVVAELGIQRFSRMNESNEWIKGGEGASSILMLSDWDLEDWVESIAEGFHSEMT